MGWRMGQIWRWRYSLNLDSTRISIIVCVFVEIRILTMLLHLHFSRVLRNKRINSWSQASHCTKDWRCQGVYKWGISTENEDNKGDESAAVVEKAVEPEAAQSNSEPESAKSPPIGPVKNREDGSPDEPDKKQSGTNDASPRASESIRYTYYVFVLKHWHLSFVYYLISLLFYVICLLIALVIFQ